MHRDITTLRESIASKRRELRHLQSGNARVSLNIALARVDEYIAHQQTHGGRLVNEFVEVVTLAGRRTPDEVSNNPRNLEATIAALLPDLIGDALKARVRDQYGSDVVGVDPDELPQRIASLEAELLALEFRDVELSEKHGEPPRPDTDPRALLGIA